MSLAYSLECALVFLPVRRPSTEVRPSDVRKKRHEIHPRRLEFETTSDAWTPRARHLFIHTRCIYMPACLSCQLTTLLTARHTRSRTHTITPCVPQPCATYRRLHTLLSAANLLSSSTQTRNGGSSLHAHQHEHRDRKSRVQN